ncbi:MAG: tRNA-binding protein [Candidatus Micrarchaeia archaeon]
MEISFSDFEKVDIRVGKIAEVDDFSGTRVPSYKLLIDFGPEIGLKRSSAHVTNYRPGDLIGKEIIAVVNLKPKKVKDFESEVLVLGVPDVNGRVILLVPDRDAPIGSRMF